jgi:hypothetical protein
MALVDDTLQNSLPNGSQTGSNVLANPLPSGQPTSPSAASPGAPTTVVSSLGGALAGSGAFAAAAGGAIPDPGDYMPASPYDPGNTADFDNALGVVQQALQYGRKTNGMPATFVGNQSATGGSPDDESDQTAQQQGAGGYATGGVVERPYRNKWFAKNHPGQKQPWGKAKGFLNGGDVDDPETAFKLPGPGADSMAFDNGGVLPDPTGGGDMDNPANAGRPPAPSDNQPTPQPGQTQTDPSQQSPPQKMAGYIMGADGVTPDVAQAAETQVDPQGQMDPSQRKLLAIAQQGNPQQAWGLMQHYRQKFNAYNAFAKVAAQGTPQKPADLGASTQAATQAYQNVPDGTSMTFTPKGNKVAVSVKRFAGGKGQQGYADGGAVQASSSSSSGKSSGNSSSKQWSDEDEARQQINEGVNAQAPGGSLTSAALSLYGAGASAQGISNARKMTGYDDGGAVDDDNPTPVQMAGAPLNEDDNSVTAPVAGGNPPLPTPAPQAKSQGVIPAPDDQAAAQVSDPNHANEDQATVDKYMSPEAIRNFVLSIPQYVHWLAHDGQADSVQDKGVEKTLSDAEKTIPQMQSPPPPSGAPHGVPNTRPATSPSPSSFQGVPVQNLQTRPVSSTLPQQQLQPVQMQQQEPAIDPDIQRQAWALFPWGDQARPRQQFILQQLGSKQSQGNTLALQELKNKGQLETWGVRGANAATLQNVKNAAIDWRNQNKINSQIQIAAMNIAGRQINAQQAETVRLIGQQLQANPTLADDPATLMKQIAPYAAKAGMTPQTLIQTIASINQSTAPQQQVPTQGQQQGQGQPIPAGGKAALVAGTIYQTARGPMKWSGTGFTAAGQ